jgi:hypothetical protein
MSIAQPEPRLDEPVKPPSALRGGRIASAAEMRAIDNALFDVLGLR